MKTLIATATGLALLAGGAFANPNEDDDPKTGRVTLNAVVADYIAITGTEDSTMVGLNVLAGTADGANNNVNLDSGEEKATFTVAANVEFDVQLAWATWQSENVALPDGASQTYQQAYYYNGGEGADCAIGGTIHFDEDVATDGAVAYPSGGASPWDVATYDPVMSRTFGIGTQAEANLTNCAGDIAAPGTYSLDVDITLSKAST